MPETASGRYLLSGGLLICPTCGGNFEPLRGRASPVGAHLLDAETETGNVYEYAGAAHRMQWSIEESVEHPLDNGPR